MQDIKIFVSNRIDKESIQLDNPLYYPVRCGAVYDNKKSDIPGDNTGDNISNKRESYCELTVLYWAWKNVKADYYGLCHYRRYISFSDKFYEPKNVHGIVSEPWLDDLSIDKYCLDEKTMRSEIEKYDMISTPPEDTYFCGDGKIGSVYDLCKKRKRDFDMDGVDELINIINKNYPEYAQYTKQYFNNHYAKFYNCFIMKKELFNQFCEFLFGVLFQLENKLNTEYYNVWKTRMLGFMGENLFGIFCLKIQSEKKYKLCEKELIYFENTDKVQELKPAFDNNNVPIVFSSSDFFVPYAAVFIQSIIDNSNANNGYDIIIFESAISDANKKLLLSMIHNLSNISIRFFNPKPLIKNVKFFVNSAQQSEEAYYRILAPYILKNYNKAIVMDCDIIAKCDITELYNIDLGEKIAAIVPDAVWHGWYNGMHYDELKDYINKTFHIRNPYNYVNTGVIVFNLEAYREKFSMEYVIKFAQSEKFMIQEQDVLNVLLEDKIKFLNIAWNMYALVDPSIKEAIENYAPKSERKEYELAHDNPKLVHWAAHPKPWENPEIDLGYEFWQIARKTPFYEIIISRLIDSKTAILHQVVYSLQLHTKMLKQVNDTRSGARKLADKFAPYGSKRRKLLKCILPKGSRRWNFCGKMYYMFKK